jgi:hypothetical protein
MPLDPPLPTAPVDARLCDLADLPDHACVLVKPAHPALDAPAATDLGAGAGKLLLQFIREGRATTAAWHVAADGAALVLAWDGGPLSGCAHDRLARLCAHHQQRHGQDLLAPPPILVQTAEGWRCVDRRGLRALASTGAVTPASLLLDARVETLGAWRRAGCVPLAASWAAPLLPASA